MLPPLLPDPGQQAIRTCFPVPWWQFAPGYQQLLLGIPGRSPSISQDVCLTAPACMNEEPCWECQTGTETLGNDTAGASKSGPNPGTSQNLTK